MKDYGFFEKVYGGNFDIKEVKVDDDLIFVTLFSNTKKAVCPFCGDVSNQKHSTYKRLIADTPFNQKHTRLNIKAYKYYCKNADCRSKVFAEDIVIAGKKAHRTFALNQLILAIACEFSSEGTSRILGRMGVTVSGDTIDRIIAKINIKDNVNIERIGIDDFAYRKGQTYCTAIYDMDTHKPIAILDGRSGNNIKEWLSGHKQVKIVARDRDCFYAKAISEILPNCIQVADKFHIMQNLMNVIKEIAKEDIPSKIYIKDNEIIEKPTKMDFTQDIIKAEYDNSPIIDKNTDKEITITGRKKYSKDYITLKKRLIESKK